MRVRYKKKNIMFVILTNVIKILLQTLVTMHCEVMLNVFLITQILNILINNRVGKIIGRLCYTRQSERPNREQYLIISNLRVRFVRKRIFSYFTKYSIFYYRCSTMWLSVL